VALYLPVCADHRETSVSASELLEMAVNQNYMKLSEIAKLDKEAQDAIVFLRVIEDHFLRVGNESAMKQIAESIVLIQTEMTPTYLAFKRCPPSKV